MAGTVNTVDATATYVRRATRNQSAVLRTATVIGVPVSNADPVLVRMADGTQFNVSRLNSYYPQYNDTVTLINDRDSWLILGRSPSSYWDTPGGYYNATINGYTNVPTAWVHTNFTEQWDIGNVAHVDANGYIIIDRNGWYHFDLMGQFHTKEADATRAIAYVTMNGIWASARGCGTAATWISYSYIIGCAVGTALDVKVQVTNGVSPLFDGGSFALQYMMPC